MKSETKSNETIQRDIAEIIVKEIPLHKYLITLTQINCPANLSQIKIYFSIIPENFSGTALKILKKESKNIAQLLSKRRHLKRVPKLIWQIDKSHTKIFEIEKDLKE
ncbi:ribosome-binding factor A [bacterium]|nr:ribosome-binding factor A [bacterium]